MKKLIFTSFIYLVLLLNIANAQTEKGTWLLGGSASFVSVEDVSVLTINPNIGVFVTNNFALGLNASFSKVEDNDPLISFGPVARFYLGNSDSGKFFGQLGGTLLTTSEFNDFILGYGLKAGYAVFISKSIALEFAGGYDGFRELNDDAYKYSGYGVTIGFQIHFNKDE